MVLREWWHGWYKDLYGPFGNLSSILWLQHGRWSKRWITIQHFVVNEPTLCGESSGMKQVFFFLSESKAVSIISSSSAETPIFDVFFLHRLDSYISVEPYKLINLYQPAPTMICTIQHPCAMHSHTEDPSLYCSLLWILAPSTAPLAIHYYFFQMCCLSSTRKKEKTHLHISNLFLG